MQAVKGVLFDLDGTLLDTAPDLVNALNQIRMAESLPPMTVAELRPIANLGSRIMVKRALGMEECDPRFQPIREKFFAFYEKHIAEATQFFPQIENVLTWLENKSIPWGIVTNKLTRHTLPLLNALGIQHRPACIVCGDSLAKAKPDPLPIRHACELLQLAPADCIYVGDAATDVIASKAAGTKSLVALYGYIQEDENPYAWNADGYVKEAEELLEWF